MKILIIKPSSLGDIIHSLPVCVCLKKLFPESYVSYLVFTKFSEILDNNSYIDQIILWDKKNISLKYIFGLIKNIRQKKFDIVIDLQGLFRTGIIAYFSKSKYKLGCPGLKEMSFLFLKEVNKFDKTQHAVERNLEVIKYIAKIFNKTININRDILQNNIKEFFPLDINSHFGFAKKLLLENSFKFNTKLIGIIPSAGQKKKIWSKENFAVLCNEIIDKFQYKIIFFGSKNDNSIVNMICNKIHNKKNIINVCGKINLKQLVSLLSFCNLVIGNDTGPIHIASALDIPVIGLYGPSKPLQLLPYNKKSIFIYKRYINDIKPSEILEKLKNAIL